MGKRGKKFIWKGIEFDSPEETFFAMWLEELKEAGFIQEWLRVYESIEVTEAVKNTYREGNKIKSQSILQNLSYTPDFAIVWNSKAYGIFFGEFASNQKIVEPFIASEGQSVVEVKPIFNRDNMTRLFRQIQKVLYKTHNLYVNQVITQILFDKTFTPQEYLLTPTGKQRKITKWKVRTLKEYLHEKIH